MGFGTRKDELRSCMVKTFWPDDTDMKFYLSYGAYKVAEIIHEARKRWPEVHPEHIKISAEHIQTDFSHIGPNDEPPEYGADPDSENQPVYDPADWTTFIVVELTD